MRKWEYIASWCDYPTINQELTAHGDQGWELVNVHLNDREGRWYIVFKREKTEIVDGVDADAVATQTKCRGCGREIVEDRTPSPRGAPMTLFRNADDFELHSCSPS